MLDNDAYKAIADLDMDPIKMKLMHKSFGEGWSKARADAIDIEYRRFLYLQYANPTAVSSPTQDVDTFWHYHILDTMKYAADCDKAFGYFMHHYPYLGLLDNDEPGLDTAAANRTQELYEATFGEPYIRAEAYAEPGVGDGEPDGQLSGNARCQPCTAARPAVKAARCQPCTATRPAVNAARCQPCTVARPAQKAARCQPCTVARPAEKAARCQPCTVARPAQKAARCQPCTVARPAQKAERCQPCTVATPAAKVARCQLSIVARLAPALVRTSAVQSHKYKQAI